MSIEQKEYRTGYEKLSTKEDLYDTLSRYRFLLNQVKELLYRDFSKYRTIPIIMGATGLRSSYGSHRNIDDVSDGDNILESKDADVFFARLQEVAINPKIAKSPLELNISHSIRTVSKKLKKDEPVDYINQLYLQFLNAMKTDYLRRKEGLIYPQKELDQIIKNSFHSSIEIMLIGFGSLQRIHNMGELGLLQGKMYSLRDLEEDIAMNIFNIPQELILASNMTPTEIKENTSTFTSLEISKERIKNELQLCHGIIQDIDQAEKDWKANIVIKFINKSRLKSLFPKIEAKYNL